MGKAIQLIENVTTNVSESGMLCMMGVRSSIDLRGASESIAVWGQDYSRTLENN